MPVICTKPATLFWKELIHNEWHWGCSCSKHYFQKNAELGILNRIKITQAEAEVMMVMEQ